MAKDYYGLLGVSKTASDEEIKSAYRKLAKKYHPDLYSTAGEAEKKAAEEKFKEINHAYSVLSDPDKRAAFDAYGDENGPMGGQGGAGYGGFGGFGGAGRSGGFGFDMDDIFSTIFSGFGGGRSSGARGNAPQRGSDIRVRMTLSFEEAAFGVQKKVSVRRTEICSDCNGTGAKPGSGTKVCSNCRGTGQVTHTQNTPFGQFSSTGVCPVCKGKGKIVSDPCKTCGGTGISEKAREITVNIPAGIDNGQTITYSGEGNAGRNGGERGSLVVEIAVRQRPATRTSAYDCRGGARLHGCRPHSQEFSGTQDSRGNAERDGVQNQGRRHKETALAGQRRPLRQGHRRGAQEPYQGAEGLAQKT